MMSGPRSAVVSMEGGEGDIALLCCLPYFLGQSSPLLPSLDLTKPILILAPTCQLLAQLQRSLKDEPFLLGCGYVTPKEAIEGALYSTYIVGEGCDTAAAHKDIQNSDIVLAPATFYHGFPTNSFSAVIVFKSNYLRQAVKTNIIMTFTANNIIFLKNDPGKLNISDIVKMDSDRTAALRHFADLNPLPRLVKHGGHMKDTYITSDDDSVLTKRQQMSLRILVDWFTYSNMKNEYVVADSILGYEPTAKMICCLPYMYGWAVGAKLIRETELDLRLPVLMLGRKEIAKHLWNLVNSKPFYIPSDRLVSYEKSTDSLYRSFLVKDTASARSIRLIVGNDDVAVSDIEHLEDLPHDCFSMVITYTMGPIRKSSMDAILAKFGANSKIIFINTNDNYEPASSSTHTLLKNEEKDNVPNTTTEITEITELPHLPTHAVASPRCSPSPDSTRTPVRVKGEVLPDTMIPTERPRCYKKMAATKLPPDDSLHSGTSITTSSLHATTEVSKLNDKVMMEKHSKFTFYRLKGYHSPKKGERRQVAENDAKEKEAILALKVKKSLLTFQQAASKKGAQQQTDISTTMSQASDPSVLHSVKVPKTKSKSELLGDKLSMPSNNKIEKTKKIGEKKTESKRKGNSSNDKKRGGKLLKKLIPERIQQTLKKWKLKNLQTTPDHEGLQRAEKSSILKMTLMCWKRTKSC